MLSLIDTVDVPIIGTPYNYLYRTIVKLYTVYREFFTELNFLGCPNFSMTTIIHGSNFGGQGQC